MSCCFQSKRKVVEKNNGVADLYCRRVQRPRGDEFCGSVRHNDEPMVVHSAHDIGSVRSVFGDLPARHICSGRLQRIHETHDRREVSAWTVKRLGADSGNVQSPQQFRDGGSGRPRVRHRRIQR